MKDLILVAINSIPKKFKKDDKVFIVGNDIPFVISEVNHMSYDVVYDIEAEEYEKYKAIYEDSFNYQDIMGGLGSIKVPNFASPHSSQDIAKAVDIIEFGSRWVVYEHELVAR